MAIPLSDEIKGFFAEPNFAHFATVRPDGSPQVAPVWVDLEGDRILLSSNKNSAKVKATRRDPRVAISIVSQSNPYHEAYLRGRVVEWRSDGAGDRLHALSRKYIGKDFPFPVDDQVTLLIEVDAAKAIKIPIT